MRIRVLRVLEYVYASSAVMEQDMSRWGVQGTVIRQGVTVKSVVLPIEVLPNTDVLADALETCRSELGNYTKTELGDAQSTVTDAIEEATRALRAAGRLS